MTEKEKTDTTISNKKTQEKPHSIKGKINNACDYHMKSLKNIISGFSSSKKFEKKMTRMSKTNDIRTNAALSSPSGPPIVMTAPRWKGGKKHKPKRKNNKTKRKNDKIKRKNNKTKRKNNKTKRKNKLHKT